MLTFWHWGLLFNDSFQLCAMPTSNLQKCLLQPNAASMVVLFALPGPPLYAPGWRNKRRGCPWLHLDQKQIFRFTPTWLQRDAFFFSGDELRVCKTFTRDCFSGGTRFILDCTENIHRFQGFVKRAQATRAEMSAAGPVCMLLLVCLLPLQNDDNPLADEGTFPESRSCVFRCGQHSHQRRRHRWTGQVLRGRGCCHGNVCIVQIHTENHIYNANSVLRLLLLSHLGLGRPWGVPWRLKRPWMNVCP